jgi:hypothetical protein
MKIWNSSAEIVMKLVMPSPPAELLGEELSNKLKEKDISMAKGNGGRHI